MRDGSRGKALALVLLAVLASARATAAADRLFSFERGGELLSGARFSVRVAESFYQPAPEELPDDGGRWGIDGGFPRSLCSLFEVEINGRNVDIPRKLHQDLSHLTRVEVSEQAGDVVVLVQGGDAAGSFEARFVFREFEVERVVRAGESPNSAWERTTYHNSNRAGVR
jgi:hypothetical protein